MMLVPFALFMFVPLVLCDGKKSIQMNDSGTDDWRVAISKSWLVQLLTELAICAFCPMPHLRHIEWMYIDPDGCPAPTTTVSNTTATTSALLPSNQYARHIKVPLNMVLSIPMVLRLFLACRSFVAHSRLFKDPSTRSIAALNRINVNFGFVIKTKMQETPFGLILGFTFSFWLIMAWLLTQCERHAPASPTYGRPMLTYSNSLWIVVITFMSVGYGDTVPHTYCGRGVAIFVGITGIVVAATLVAITGTLLQLSTAEKHVNAVLNDSKLYQKMRHAAARVLQETWQIHKFRNYHRIDQKDSSMKLMKHQRKFLQAIVEFRKVKWEQRKLAEHNDQLVNTVKLQTDLQHSVVELQRLQLQLMDSMGEIHFKIGLLLDSAGKQQQSNNNVALMEE